VIRRLDGATELWSASDLVREGEELGAEIERRAGPPAKGREIAVWSGPPDDPAARSFLALAILRGAALVLEPDPYSRIATVLWVRPTVFLGDATDLAALRQSLHRERTRSRFRKVPVLPLRRLRAVVWSGSGTLAEGEEAFWTERGVAFLAAERRGRGI